MKWPRLAPCVLMGLSPVAFADETADGLRYRRDMLTDESLSRTDLLDIYDAANPDSWDKDDNGPGSHGSTGTADDVIVRWEGAADTVGFGAAHDDQKNKGQDH